VEQVADGLGPTFNSNSCSSCHAQPALGGSSPSATQYPISAQILKSRRRPRVVLRTGFPFSSPRMGRSERRASRLWLTRMAP
jgi:cytochrome c peroxidase